MAKWYSYTIDPSNIVKDPSKKHYLRTQMSFSMAIKPVNDSSYAPRVYYYGAGSPEILYKQWERNTQATLTGYITIDRINSPTVYVIDAGHTSGNEWSVHWQDMPTLTTGYYRAYVPTVSFVYGSKAIPVGQPSFVSGYIDPTKSKSISFSTTNQNIDVQYSVTSGVLYYKKTSDANYSSIAFTGDTVVIPANTLVTGNSYEMYATLVADDGTSFTYSFGSITTVDGMPSVAVVSPNNRVIYGKTVFEWQYSNETGSDQHAYDIDLSDDRGETWTTIFSHVVSTETKSAEYSDIPAGNYLWRVRAYNNDDVVSEWATGSFVCNVPPNAPTITEIIPGGRITVKWTSENQAGYRIVITDMQGAEVYNTGDVYSITGSCFVNYYLPNGAYILKVKIINIFGLESEYTEYQYVQNRELSAPTVTTSVTDAVGITINNPEDYVRYYLIRNGEVIASFTDPTYTDLFAVGETRYRLLAINANDDFGKYDFIANVSYGNARLITKSGEIFEVNSRWGNPFGSESQESMRFGVSEYLGAKVPEHTFSKMRTKSITIVFYDENRVAPELLGETLFYSDGFGNGNWVVITTVGRQDAWYGDNTTLQMELTNGNEVIEYEI